ncbi:ROK family protein [Paremcibacter congregatus]|uniref:fructokinase n=1 Tax=Paremcibacter congregatus TaxID=2043170 RepID=A0A2G4YS11_9PROT|nr:ROK family protein [Paremcibacter congregatus]PHZ85098.1 fructokinase [Paremcibacter congregatus]QDE27952.1 ROK family protein [Paremcibacter congregatus]
MSRRHSENILFGGVEAGGTNFNCVMGYGDGDIIARRTIPTTTPENTLAQVVDFFKEKSIEYGPVQALGIAHFGPIDINKASRSYGKILLTVKPGWSYFDIVGYFSNIFSVPVAFQSDVNGAAIGERYFGGAKENDNFVYMTVGTGIGGGAFVNGHLVNNLQHPEIGHMLVPHDVVQDSFPGSCPVHGDCLEGLASGSAIKSRWGSPGESLPENSAVWELEAHYLAILCVNLCYCYAPEKIILGGGVMGQKQIFPILHRKFLELMHGYMTTLNEVSIKDFIVPTRLAGEAATKGSLILAHQGYFSETAAALSPRCNKTHRFP